MLYNKEFLLKLDKCKNKVIYAKITSLTFQEYPIESVEGRVTQGSINLDGASAVRRTCSLTFVAKDFNYSNYLWGLNTKFKLEIGVENTLDSAYPNIIWFNQGIYLISSFNTSRSTNNFTISIQGKDKMSMLNGEVGGTINSSIDFGTIEEEDQNGNWVIRKLPIKEIILNMVHQYGGEPLHNIIINDLPEFGLELLEYRYDKPMYLYRLVGVGEGDVYENATLDGDIPCSVEGKPDIQKLSDLTSNELDMLVEPLMGNSNDSPSVVKIEDKDFYIAKVEYGQTAGYRRTELVYAGDLIANIGESIVSVLDKIKNMLGEFEYFYDLEGHFVFQQKQSFVNTMYGVEMVEGTEDVEFNKKETYVAATLAHADTTQYIFTGGDLITTFNNNPNLLNLRNDYSIWGQRTSVSGAQIPVHFRYAIDTKPIQYQSISVSMNNEEDKAAIDRYNKKHGTTLGEQNSVTYSADFNKVDPDVVYCDWREVIYQMARDYYKYNHLDDFELKVAAANPEYYPFGITGYEQYYIDIQGFWRQLYNPELQDKIDTLEGMVNEEKGQLIKAIEKLEDELKDETLSVTERQIKELDLETAKTNLINAQQQLQSLQTEKENYYYENNDEHKYWNKSVYTQPEVLNFWFDFLDTEGELNQFNSKVIGVRPKAVNDSNIKSIYFRDTPGVLFTEDVRAEKERWSNLSEGSYKYIQAPGILNMFTISAQGKSAKVKLDELLYQHGYCIESATINCIPIYYLQPNIRVHIVDKETHLDGDYIISKITIPLTHNGTMSLTATKAVETFLY